ncbi:hypothetical protein BIY24_05865 [Halobacteriovorax marinus]|uniref:hypothetical protein n=1 Tax=Halobacteriovorax marinus TaxID=97084 RepID=UPI000BC35FB1|nr:hypothetical protein [Halobacteriovorax marinus]ATH07485.1 hypothetical protein BIY24_05865 [Halobacteriovorax marinus]
MKFLITLFFLVSQIYAQENFGIEEKVNSVAKRGVRRILVQDFIAKLEKFRNHENKPKEYYESLGLNKRELGLLLGATPIVLKNNLPKMSLTKNGIITFTYKNKTASFSIDDLNKHQIRIEGRVVALPSYEIKEFDKYILDFHKNIAKAFPKKVSLMNLFNELFLIQSANAQYYSAEEMSGEEYLNLPDNRDVPYFSRKGWEKDKPVIRALYENSNLDYNVNQTLQVLTVAIMAISVDLGLNDMANFRNKKKNLPENLKKFYKRIDEMATTCDKEKLETNGKFREGSDATNMLIALDRVNERINRLENMSTLWWQELNPLLWNHTSFRFDPDSKSYNICLVKRIKEIYHDPKLCDNLDKITKCLIAFRSSGRVIDKTLTDDQMDLLLENYGGRDYGEKDILRWMNEK